MKKFIAVSNYKNEQGMPDCCVESEEPQEYEEAVVLGKGLLQEQACDTVTIYKIEPVRLLKTEVSIIEQDYYENLITSGSVKQQDNLPYYVHVTLDSYDENHFL